MNKKTTPYIYIFFFIVFSSGIFAQKLTLEINSKNSNETAVLNKIDFKKNHSTKKLILKEVNLISNKLKWLGYFYNSFHISEIKNSHIATFSLGQKIKTITISIPSEIKFTNIKNNTTIAVANLPSFLKTISNQLDTEGKSFSEVTLKNILLKNNMLFADLHIIESKKRTIDKVIVKGYENFSKSHISHFLQLKKGNVFNQQKLNKASLATKALPFVSEIKPPEVLFSKDSTIIYMYLKRKNINTFDGLLNFTSKENESGLLFNGHINLQLNNVLHTGEQFTLLWKANGEERQDFKTSISIPYVFNSRFTPKLSFNIYKQDSTFLNTKFNSKIRYTLNSKTSVGISYQSENSKNTLQNTTNTDILNFSNSFWGLWFEYRLPQNNFFFEDLFFANIHSSYGTRTTKDVNSPQFKIDFEISYLLNLTHRSFLFLKNKSGYLNSKSFLKNEIYRIGGTNSIRGFNEQSVFASKFSYINIEYRYITSNNSYLYSITDFGKTENEKLLGIGIGYTFKLKNSWINLAYTLGKTANHSFNFNNSKLGVSFRNYF